MSIVSAIAAKILSKHAAQPASGSKHGPHGPPVLPHLLGVSVQDPADDSLGDGRHLLVGVAHARDELHQVVWGAWVSKQNGGWFRLALPSEHPAIVGFANPVQAFATTEQPPFPPPPTHSIRTHLRQRCEPEVEGDALGKV